jgi:hypothetical protein
MPGSDVRYGAACNELCTRLSIRNNTLLHFTAFSSGIFAFAIKGGADASIIGVSIPYLSLFIILISNYHERTIYKLKEYQVKLLEEDKEDIPIWYSDEFYGSLQSARIMRDYAQLYIILPISIGALLLIYARWNEFSPQYRTTYLIAVIVGCICLMTTATMLWLNIRTKRKQRIRRQAPMAIDPSQQAPEDSAVPTHEGSTAAAITAFDSSAGFGGFPSK